jgi:Glycine zipper/Prokaryotic membrane lipoprotein lipid attachment site
VLIGRHAKRPLIGNNTLSSHYERELLRHERRTSMRKIAFALVAVAALAGCTNAEKGAVVGGVGGAALGTLAGGNDARNALVGGVLGATAGTLIGAAQDRQGFCRYRDRQGRIYEAPCR